MIPNTHPGVTASEFLALCKTHVRYPSVFPASTISEFLDRCCEVGLLSKRVGDQSRIEYVATDSLCAVFSVFDED